MFQWRMSKIKEPKMPQCECGCGDVTKGGRFLPGHDAKLKKSLIESALEGSKRAATKLEKLGWTKFLAAKQEGLAKGKGNATAARKPEGKRAERRKGGNSVESSGAAEAARAFAPTLDPPLDERTARIMGFGAPIEGQE